MRCSVVGLVGTIALGIALSCSSGDDAAPHDAGGSAGTGGRAGTGAAAGGDGAAATNSAGSSGQAVGGRGLAGSRMGAGGDGAGADASAGAGGSGDVMFQPLCPVAGWCWENPLPAGNALYAVSGSSSSDVWAVGDNGTILHYDGQTWSAVPSGVSERLTGVWAASASEAWISGTNGALLRWDGNAWGPAGQPPALTYAYAVTGWVDASGAVPKSTVWFTDDGSPIRVSAGQWLREMLPQTPFTFASVWADSGGALWAVGSNGGLSRLAGGVWTPFGTGSTSRFVSAHGDTQGNVWAVSEQAEIVRVDARGVASGFTNDAAKGLSGVHAFGPSDAWAVGGGGTLLHFDGAKWTSRAAGTSFDLLAVWGASPSDVWLVGDRGTIVHCDETACSPPNGQFTANLSAVWSVSADEAWAVGAGGVILRRSAAGWRSVESPTKTDLTAVWGSGPNDVWFGGYQVLLRWNGSTLSKVDGLPNGAAALHGRATDDLWALSASSPAHWDGKTFAPSNQVASSAIFEAAAGDVWVGVFDNSTNMGHFDGQSWAKVTAPSCVSLSGTGPKDVWCAGGINLKTSANHWDGAAWTSVSTSAGDYLTAVASSGPNAMWYVGGSGVLGSCSGSSCTGYAPNGAPGQRAFVTDSLSGVATFGSDVYVVGRRGVILHRRP